VSAAACAVSRSLPLGTVRTLSIDTCAPRHALLAPIVRLFSVARRCHVLLIGDMAGKHVAAVAWAHIRRRVSLPAQHRQGQAC
jgi:hypothetical protein